MYATHGLTSLSTTKLLSMPGIIRDCTCHMYQLLKIQRRPTRGTYPHMIVNCPPPPPPPPPLWTAIQTEIGSVHGHTCDLMAQDSNAMLDQLRSPLPHFTPQPSSQSLGGNFFAQDLSMHTHILPGHIIFPPTPLVAQCCII